MKNKGKKSAKKRKSNLISDGLEFSDIDNGDNYTVKNHPEDELLSQELKKTGHLSETGSSKQKKTVYHKKNKKTK